MLNNKFHIRYSEVRTENFAFILNLSSTPCIIIEYKYKKEYAKSQSGYSKIANVGYPLPSSQSPLFCIRIQFSSHFFQITRYLDFAS